MGRAHPDYVFHFETTNEVCTSQQRSYASEVLRDYCYWETRRFYTIIDYTRKMRASPLHHLIININRELTGGQKS